MYEMLSKLRESERGTAVVEFALVAPMLFALVFGIVEFGRALNYYNDLTQLAGQAARAAAVNRNPDGSAVGAGAAPCTTNQSIQCQIVNVYPTTAELQNGISTCLGTLNTTSKAIDGTTVPAIGQPVTVRTRFKFNFLTHLFTFASITLTATQSEIQEAVPSYGGGNVAGTGGGDACAAP